MESHLCTRVYSLSGPYSPHHDQKNQPTFPLLWFRRAPSQGPTWSPPKQRNCMSKCQRHSVQLLTARTVNDRRRRRPSSSSSSLLSLQASWIESCSFYHELLLINIYAVSKWWYARFTLSLSLSSCSSSLSYSDLFLSSSFQPRCPRRQIFRNSRARSRMFAGVSYFARTSLFKGLPSSALNRTR